MRGFNKIVNYGATADHSNRQYARWLQLYEQTSKLQRETAMRRIMSIPEHPLISILLPIYNTDQKWLTEAIASCQAQHYPNWELCIADDASTLPEVHALLKALATADERIKLVIRNHQGVAEALNSALDIAHGDWVTLLGHTDRLAENALYNLALAATRHIDAQIIYSDEDKLDEDGHRFAPYFKCDWNQDLFYSRNFLAHLCAYRGSLIKAHRFNAGMDGAHDYDLALRCIEHISPKHIVHIPSVLYHWRTHHNSIVSEALMPAERALNKHFQRKNLKACIESTPHGFRIKYPLPRIPPLVSLIIPSRNALNLLRQCIDSICTKTTYPNYEIIIIDNGSDDTEVLNYFKSIAAHPNISVIHDDRPFNYSALNNRAANVARGELIALLNNDIEVITPEWLGEMVSQALRPEIGAVGAKLLYPDNTVQHGGIVLGIGGCAGHAHKGLPRDSSGYFYRAQLVSNFSAVTAACLVVRKSVFDEVGGLDETNLAVAFNDVDFCLRLIKAGYRNLWTPYAELYHHESATRGRDDTPEQKARLASEEAYMKATWGDWIRNDPAYNPNLTLEHENFSLAYPPRDGLFIQKRKVAKLTYD